MPVITECDQVTTRTDFKLFGNSCFYVSPDTDNKTWRGAKSLQEAQIGVERPEFARESEESRMEA